MKCLRCNLVNFNTETVCRRCQFPLFAESASAPGNRSRVYHDSGLLVVEDVAAALPRRCYRCNSRKIVATKPQTLEYTPLSEALLGYAVGQLLPLPVDALLPSNGKAIQLDLYFCRRHLWLRGTLHKVGWGLLIFSALCFALGLSADALFVVSMMTSVAAFCFGLLTLYLESQREVLAQHKYQAPYFWVKGFGSDYLSSFPDWINSPPRR